MKFEIFGSDNKIKFVTTSLSCIPTDSKLKVLKYDGYRFKVDGKFIHTISNIRPSGNIFCKETGKYFKTQAEAAKEYNIDPAYVSESIRKCTTVKGYTFEKLN